MPCGGVNGGEWILSGKEKQEGKSHAELDLAGGKQFPQLAKALRSLTRLFCVQSPMSFLPKGKAPLFNAGFLHHHQNPMQSRSPVAVTCLSLEKSQVSGNKMVKDNLADGNPG